MTVAEDRNLADLSLELLADGDMLDLDLGDGLCGCACCGGAGNRSRPVFASLGGQLGSTPIVPAENVGTEARRGGQQQR